MPLTGVLPVRKFYKYSLWKGYGILKDMLRKNISWGILENPQESYYWILVSLRNPEVHMPYVLHNLIIIDIC